MTLLTGRAGRPYNLRETTLVAFGLAMIVVLGAHIATWIITHSISATTLAVSEIALGGAARVINRFMGGA